MLLGEVRSQANNDEDLDEQSAGQPAEKYGQLLSAAS